MGTAAAQGQPGTGTDNASPGTEGGAPGAAGGAPGAGDQAAGAATGAVEFDRGQLHPALRDMTPAQITELFETMAQGLASTRQPPAAASVAPAPPPPPLKTDDVRKYFDPSTDDFNPIEGVNVIVQRNYGRLIGDIAGRGLRSTFATFERQFPDFSEFEADILKSMEGRDPTTVTEKDILSSYLAHKGLRVTMKEQAERARSKGAVTQPPSGREPARPEVELSDVEKDVARRMFGSKRDKDGKPVDPLVEYRRIAAMESSGSGLTVKVPVGGGKYE